MAHYLDPVTLKQAIDLATALIKLASAAKRAIDESRNSEDLDTSNRG
jgi:hypothetical protein